LRKSNVHRLHVNVLAHSRPRGLATAV
jgi:hypothetical protein